MKWLLVVIGILVFIGCEQETNNELGDVSPHTDDDSDTQSSEVYLSLNKENYLSEDDVFLLTIHNESDEAVSYGAPFTIEYLEDNQWKQVIPEQEMVFIMIAYLLEGGNEAEEHLSMDFFEPLDLGEYRVVKQIDGEVLTAEFEVIAE